MAISLKNLQQTKHAAPPRIVIHGPAKVGKSTFFAGSPNAVFIQTEDGLSGIDATAFPLAKIYNEVKEALESLLSEQHEYKTVVIDSADWLEKLIHRHVCTLENVPTIEKASGGYGKGFLEANNFWREIIDLLDKLRNERGLLIAIICHSRLKTINDPQLEPYDCWQLKLHSPKSGNGACEILSEWSDIIGFAQTKTYQSTKKTKLGNDQIFSATDSGQRVLCLSNSAAYLAGNRYSLPDEIPLKWSSLMNALTTQSQTNNQQRG